jgi:D-alanyl-D-alanine carboxypeptidase
MRRRALAALIVVLAGVAAPAVAHAYRYSRGTVRAPDRVVAPGGRHVSALVVDVGTGRPLYSRRLDTRRVLASNTKLFVTATAAYRWGATVAPTLVAVLRPSDNVLAERLAARLGHGDAHAGVRAAVRFARSLGVRVRLHDAAGLNTANRATARQMVRFLLAMRHVRGFSAWKRALPIAARSGTLAYRLHGTPAAGRCHAKTGTLFLHTLASALSGYCTTRSGAAVAFSLLVGGTPIGTARAIEDRFVARVAGR